LANVPWSLRGDDVLLSVRVTPKSSRDEIVGIEDLADGRAVLKVRVRAAPEDGKANEAVIRMLAKALRIRASAVELEGGAASRVKTLRLEGDAENLTAGLARLCGRG
jgi:uncharacterized protein